MRHECRSRIARSFWPVDDTQPAIFLSGSAAALTFLTFVSVKYGQSCHNARPRISGVRPRRGNSPCRIYGTGCEIFHTGLRKSGAGLRKSGSRLRKSKSRAKKKGKEFGKQPLSFCYRKYKSKSPKRQIGIFDFNISNGVLRAALTDAFGEFFWGG